MNGAALAREPVEEIEKYEIINGKTFMFAKPATNHADVATNLSRLWANYLRGKHCRLYMETSLFLDEKNQFSPDLMVVCDRKKIRPNGVHGAPDLVIEILSPDTAARDRGVKKDEQVVKPEKGAFDGC